MQLKLVLVELQQVQVDLQVMLLLQGEILRFLELHQLVEEEVVIFLVMVELVDQVVELMHLEELVVQEILRQ
jgi:hypothetical protein